MAACTDDPAGPRRIGALRRDAAVGTPSLLVSGLDPNLCAAVARGSQDLGTELVTAPCDPAASAQRFTLQPSGVISVYDGSVCLDARGQPSGYGNDGDVVQIWTCNAWDNQRWAQTAAGELVGVNGKCLDVYAARTTPGTAVIIWTCHGQANQRWTFRPVTAPIEDVGGSAELPRQYVNTDLPAVTGNTITVDAGGDLQAALDAAQPGDQVVLAPGATFVGNFELKPKAGMTGTQWIIVRSGGALPAPGTRVSPADAAQMPKVLTPDANPAIRTAPAAQGWRLVGLEVSSTTSVEVNTFVRFGGFGADQNTDAQIPSRLVLDRSYVHGRPDQWSRRCVGLHSRMSAVIDSYVTECHHADPNSDAQAIAGWNGPGPYKILNNYLAGSHESIAFGGADPDVPQLIPSDIEIRRNHITKPLAWRSGPPRWPHKNLIEFKAGQRVLIEANVFENSWPGETNQTWALLFWSANADGNALWSVTQDVTLRYNHVRNVFRAFWLKDRYCCLSGPLLPKARRFTIAHNVVTGLDGELDRAFAVDSDVQGVTIARNTAVARPLGGGGHDIIFIDVPGLTFPDFVFRNNVTGGEYTFFASGIGQGNAVVTNLQIPPANVAGNVFAGGWAPNTPSGNSHAATIADVGFVNFAGGDLRLSPSSPFLTSGTGGTRPGADVDAVMRMTQGVVP